VRVSKRAFVLLIVVTGCERRANTVVMAATFNGNVLPGLVRLLWDIAQSVGLALAITMGASGQGFPFSARARSMGLTLAVVMRACSLRFPLSACA